MKKYLILVLVASFAFAPAVSAQESRGENSGKPLPIRPIPVGELKERAVEMRNGMKDRLIATATPIMKERREEFKGRMEDRMLKPLDNRGPKSMHSSSTASTSERRIEFQQEIAKRKTEHTSRVLTATVERLENILERVNSRIAKVKANGGDVAAAEAATAKVAQDLADAKTGIASLPSLDLSGTKAKENFETVKTAVRSVQDKIKSAHKNLSDAVRSLKGREGTATTTEQ